MNNIAKSLICGALLIFVFGFSVNGIKANAQTDNITNYVKDYQTKIYDSDNGLDGTAANCIFSSESGLLWIGTYTGLYRYDGTDFQRIAINGTNMPIKDIAESCNNEQTELWIGTNGDGLWYYSEGVFTELNLDSENKGAQTIDDVYVDSNGSIWVGTKGGLFRIDEDENSKQITKIKNLEDLEVSDIAEISSNKTVAVAKSKGIYEISGNKAKEIDISDETETFIPRCVSKSKNGYYYVGTKGDCILKLSLEGEIVKVISGNGLSSFNMISEIDEDSYWICSDNGIGVLKNDNLTNTSLTLKDSVEGVCTDYQGSYWFASSRTGVMQLYPNEFSNLSNYWNLHEVVNTIQVDGDKTYVGTDNGMHCYVDSEAVSDSLTEVCSDLRIREIYKAKDMLCVATYGSGAIIKCSDDKIIRINKENSDLTTDLIRSIWQRSDGSLLLATEEGVFVCEADKTTSDEALSYNVHYLTNDGVLTSYRILDVKEDENGTVYAATDGNGLFVIKDGEVVNNFTKTDGLYSDCVLKVVLSKEKQGVWLVMSEGINYLETNNTLQRVIAVPTANTTDMVITDDCKAVLLAANGLFQVNESDLLKESNVEYKQATKKDGIPIDFTANSWSVLEDDILYICGTTGPTSVDLNEEHSKNYEVRIYIAGIYADNKEVVVEDGEISIPADTHRFSIDVRPINYVYQNITLGYMLENMDQDETLIDGGSDKFISYTNISGGKYIYHFRVMNSETKENLIEISLSVKKEYNFFEEPGVKLILLFLGITALIALVILIIYLIQSGANKQYKAQLEKEKNEEIKRLAYYDTATDTFNRNYYESIIQNLDTSKIFAAISVSVNHMEYYKKKYGVLYVDSMMRQGAKVIKDITAENDVKIFRLSENIFFYWLTSPVRLEEYIFDIKTEFNKLGNKNDVYSFAVGGVYNEGETITQMLEKCESMRTTDENLAESKFVKAKINVLN